MSTIDFMEMAMRCRTARLELRASGQHTVSDLLPIAAGPLWASETPKPSLSVPASLSKDTTWESSPPRFSPRGPLPVRHALLTPRAVLSIIRVSPTAHGSNEGPASDRWAAPVPARHFPRQR